MNSKHYSTHQAGFTLVELMVGLTIGMFVVVIIMQVLSVFEAQKRTTTGTADAQTNGSIALFNIGRELQLAGYPLMSSSTPALNCTTTTFGATGISGISPISIVDGGNSSDTITLRYGTSAMGGIPSSITATAGTLVTVNNNLGCTNPVPTPNEIALITNGTTCALTTVTALSATGANPSTITLQNSTAAAAGANLSCLGTWQEVTYRANGGNLERQVGANAAIPNVAGILNVQAQYGVSAAGLLNTDPLFNQVAQWVDATGSWATPSITDRNRIKAIRIAVVARNAKREAGNVTAACSSTTTATPTGLCSWEGSTASPAPAINLANDADGTSWQRYRYRVFETIVPLRNVIWAKSVLK